MRYLFVLILAAAPALAQETSGGGETRGMLVWQILNFLILSGGLGWLVVKYGAPLLATRAREISEGLAAGEKAKAESEARARDVQAKLGNLEKEIAALRSSAREEREREADRIRRDTQIEIARIGYQAEQEIEAAGKQARLDLRRAAAALAIDLAAQKLRARLSPGVQSSIFDGFLRDLAAGVTRTTSNAG